MNSLILTTMARVLAPLLFLVSLYILWRGHNDPGGGFIGGLVAATAVALIALARDIEHVRRVLWFEPLQIGMVGLGCAVTSAVWGFVAKGYVLAGVWPFYGEDGGLPVGSILLFDAGVYLVVIGGVCGMLLAFEQVAEEKGGDDADG